jgi:hypothetical protein
MNTNKYIKNFYNYNESITNLPVKYTLKYLYKINNNNINDVVTNLKKLLFSDGYLSVFKSDINLSILNKYEPIEIMALPKGKNTINNSTFDIESDSIGLISKDDKSIYILSVLDEFDIIINYPKIVISEMDPYGEEDWS